MILYSSIDFFVSLAFFIALLWIGKLFSQNNAWYQGIILLFCIWFYSFEFNAWLVLILYFVGNYFFLFLFLKVWPKTNGLLVSLLLLFPLVGSKVSPDLSFFHFIGLSFITFRVIQFYLDFNLIKKFPDPIKYFVYLFNPLWLMIGPIDYYQRFDQEWNSIEKKLNGKSASMAMDHLLLGLTQKLILAFLVNEWILKPVAIWEPGFAKFYLQIFSYMIYLYFDFAGYSNMAQGASLLMGIKLPANFNNPFIAKNPQDFWKRWHISLSEWLGNYFFKPYYKYINSKKAFKNYPLLKQNSGLLFTFILMGCWNGFTLYFFLSGLMFGIYSVVHNSYLQKCRKAGKDIVFGNASPIFVKTISIIIMLHLNALAIYMFSGLMLSIF